MALGPIEPGSRSVWMHAASRAKTMDNVLSAFLDLTRQEFNTVNIKHTHGKLVQIKEQKTSQLK